MDADIGPIVIRACSDLAGGSWTDVGTYVPVEGTNSLAIDGTGQQYYRLVVTTAP